MLHTRRLADPLLAAAFVASGLDAVRTPATPGTPVDPVEDGRPPDASLDRAAVVRLTGAVQIAAGTLLASGRLTRLAACALIGTLVPATTGGLRFWDDGVAYGPAARRALLVKNVGLIGGLLLAATERDGSVGRRNGPSAHPRPDPSVPVADG
jgi:putative oxidoreductase